MYVMDGVAALAVLGRRREQRYGGRGGGQQRAGSGADPD